MAIGSKRSSPCTPSAAAVFSDAMIEPRNTPCSQSLASVTSGTVVRRRPPNRIAEIGTPAGSSHSGAADGHWEAGAVKRAFGCAAGRLDLRVPGVALPVGGTSRRLVGHLFPPDVALIGECGVGEDAVAPQRLHRVVVGLVAGARCDAEETGLGVDRVQLAVVTDLHPADVVADGLGLPARDRRNEHRQVGLAACRREGSGDVLRLALRVGQLEDQHVLGEPAVVACHHRSDAQCEALLAEQSVTAVARAVRHDLACLGEVDDVLVLGVARPGDVGVDLRRAERRPSAGTAPTDRRRGRRGRPDPCGS